MGAFSFSKEERLRRPGDFIGLLKKGRRFDSEYFLVLCSRNSLGKSRLGVTVGKRVGCAVTRNRVKRLVREHFRHHKAALKGSYDVNVTAKSTSSVLRPAEMARALDAVVHDTLRKCGDEAVFAGPH